MKFTPTLLMALVLSGLSTTGLAHTPTIKQKINTTIAHFKQEKKLSGDHIGIAVMDLKTGKWLYQKNAQHRFIPASTLKLLTATAALTKLSPNYHYSTAMLTQSAIVGHTLKGNLYIRFSGDPSLKRKDLAEMIATLHRQGIQHIAGNIYLDSSHYGKIPYPPGWLWDDLSYSYAAPTNAIILDHNQFVLHLIPAKKALFAPHLQADIPKRIVFFTNEAITTTKHLKKCPLTIYSTAHNHYTLRGCLYQGYGKQRRSLAIRDTTRYAKNLLKALLKENGITYQGYIRNHNTPKKSRILVEHHSLYLSRLIRHLLKESDNLYTNSIFKTVGEAYFHQPGTWQNSIRAEEALLGKPAGIQFKHLKITDGSGLSRYNLITPSAFVKLLHYIYLKPKLYATLYNALPIAGKDGTLMSRLLHFGRRHRIHAKTGTMTGVSALVGFVQSKHHRALGFSILVNGIVENPHAYTQLEDAICKQLAVL